MKAITLMQPWATLVVTGMKRNETRSWPTRHRGPLLIHSSKRIPESARELCFQEPFRSALRAHGYKSPSDLPLGQILGVVLLDDCQPTPDVEDPCHDDEHAFGDYRPGRYVWTLSQPFSFATPVAYRGRQCIYEISDEVILPHLSASEKVLLEELTLRARDCRSPW